MLDELYTEINDALQHGLYENQEFDDPGEGFDEYFGDN